MTSTPRSPLASLGRHAFERAAYWADTLRGWHRFPLPIGILALIGLRDTLRDQNLLNTNPDTDPTPPPYDKSVLTRRTIDGSYNDLLDPTMGMAGRPFGRNISLQAAKPETTTLRQPNPRTVSRRLMTRTTFQPATTMNLLAATWIQFMVKDWFSHGQGDPHQGVTVDLDEDDGWPTDQRPMIIPSTRPNPARADGLVAFTNINTAWWDASSIYGATPEAQAHVRAHEGGRLDVDKIGFPRPVEVGPDPVSEPGFWAGLGSMGALFCLEHNAIADAIAAANPSWADEEIFQRSRLVISALIAKIHTIEWTPAILAHPTTVAALRINWYGIAGQRLRDTVGRISQNEIISGIMGGRQDHFGVPYSLTEEFSIVYRMHPLIPDDYELRHWADDECRETLTLRHLTGPEGRKVLARIDMADFLYSFGTAHPGAITLHNFPKFLQEFIRPDGKYTDLAATDILRTRELGVPRYNEFRRQLHLRPARDFADLTADLATQRTLREVYDGDIEQVDTIVGMFAEVPPNGFGFSDTAFRIFILMASRRLNSDRFFTEYFTPAVYSEVGHRWVMQNDFTSVLLRHYPQLRASMTGVKNPFAPWHVAGTGGR